jgi:hypothetical protein
MLTGVSRIASTFSSRKARARGPGSRAVHLLPDRPVAQHDEVPGLAEPHAGRLVRGGQHPGEQGIVHRIGQEPVAHVAPPGHHPVQRVDVPTR